MNAFVPEIIYEHNKNLIVPMIAISLMHHFESCSLIAYLDGEDWMPMKDRTWTIGWGNTFYANGTPVKEGDVCSQSEADSEFLHDITEIKTKLCNMIMVRLSQEQMGAVISLAYNIGIREFKNSTLLKKLNEGDYGGAAAEFKWWRKDGGEISAGLVRRRISETNLFCNVVPEKVILKRLPTGWMGKFYS